jgi:hypothetical protein
MSELFGRSGLAGVVLVLAAVVVTMSGGAGLGGRLGALFGLHSKQGGKQVSAIHAVAPAAVRHSVASARVAPRHAAPRASQPKARTRPQTGPVSRRAPVSQEGPRPAPAQQPAAPSPPPVPRPAPAPQGNVQHVVQQVRETAAPVAPPAQPVLDQVSGTVDQACGLIGGCP